MPVQNMRDQELINFNATPAPRAIQVARNQWIGPAKFLAYVTGNAAMVLGAGECPALTANPPYVTFNVATNVAFTVQSVAGPIDVTY